VAPTDIYFDVGVEAGRGRSSRRPGGRTQQDGVNSGNVFAHGRRRPGNGTAWQTGVSYLSTSPQDRTFDDSDSTGTPPSPNSFSGTAACGAGRYPEMGADYNPTYTNFKLQGEYFRRRENGDLTFNTAAPRPVDSRRSSRAGTCRGYSVRPVMANWLPLRQTEF